MTPHAAASPEPSDDDASVAGDEAWMRALVVEQIAALSELRELGMQVARETAASADRGDIARAFTGVSRAVRLTIALQSKLIADLRGWDDQQLRRTERAADEETDRRREATAERKDQIERIVDRIAAREHLEDAETIDRLVSESRERLDCEDLYGDVLARPVSEIVGLICRDLGLSPNWPLLAEEAWAQDEVAGGRVGPPLAALKAKPAFLATPRRRRTTSASPSDPHDHPPIRREYDPDGELRRITYTIPAPPP